MNGMHRTAGAIKGLVVICVIFYVITYMVPGMELTMREHFALYFPTNENFRLWQFISNIFMHGSLMHIFFNMYALWAFGSPLEQMWGHKRFYLFFFLAGIGAALIYTGVNYFRFNSLYNELLASGMSQEEILSFIKTPLNLVAEGKLQELKEIYRIPVVGASGAIYGVLVAFGILFPNAKLFLIFLPIPIAAKFFIPALIALDLFSGVTGFSIFGGGIAHFGHVGGAVIGFILMWFWRGKEKRHPRIPGTDEEGFI